MRIRFLGALALCAIVVAAVSFAIVDATMSPGAACAGAERCIREGPPPVAVGFAMLGVGALLVSVLPAVAWIVATGRRVTADPLRARGRRRHPARPTPSGRPPR